jgi:hypothetical protein
VTISTLTCHDFFSIRPSEHTLVWRGVREDLSAAYPNGKEFAWWAFSSCTASIDVLESPEYLGKSGARTIFSIQTNSGKRIRAHSYFENEDEILLPPGIFLKVIGSLNPGQDLRIIQLREIPPPHQLLTEPFDLSQMKKALPQLKPPSETSMPQKTQSYSTADVAPKPSAQVSSKQGKLTLSYQTFLLRIPYSFTTCSALNCSASVFTSAFHFSRTN